MNERNGKQEPRHPIGVVVQRTGLTTHVLRAWERRYGVVDPGRTAGGQRLYSDADVLHLRLLKRATEAGRSIGSVSGLTTEELVALVGEDVGEERSPERSDFEPYLRRCLDAADRMDGQALREELMRAVVKLSAPVFVTEVVGPLLHRVGDLWERGELRPAQEHVVSTAVRQVLDWLLARYEAPPSAPLMVVGTPSGEQHEFGAMLAAVVAADAGWRVLYLGPSLPPEEIALAAERAGAAVVAVSLVDGAEEEPEAGYDVLTDLRASVPAGVLVVAGGRRAARVPDGVTRVEDLEGLRSVLAAAGPPEGGGR